MYYPIKTHSKIIRKLPKAYQGLLTISNDVEGFDFDTFIQFYKKINSTSNCEWGRGLGLELSSSFFFYSETKKNFSYFKEPLAETEKSEYADKILNLIKLGYIDTIHGLGDFSQFGNCSKQMINRIMKEIKINNIKLDIFTNHGNTKNVTNVGFQKYQKGDNEDNPLYIGHLLQELGVKFIWTDKLVDNKNIWRFYDSIKYQLPLKQIFKMKLTDKKEYLSFRRFRNSGKFAPTHSEFYQQLKSINWKKFYQKKSSINIYQHLGYIRQKGKLIKFEKKHFTNEIEKSWNFLSSEVNSGRLLILTQKRFLNYLMMLSQTKIQINKNSIYLETKDKLNNPSNYFQGLSLNKSNVDKIVYLDSELEFEKGEKMVTIPFKKMGGICIK